MARKKLKRFAEMKSMDNVFEPNGASMALAGGWSERFGKEGRLVLELGCGRGDYVLALAERFPDELFVGMDVKGARLWAGATRAKADGRGNVLFLRGRAERLEDYFAPGEVDSIWLTFSDPFPGKEGRRLTASRFLEMYRRLLSSNGRVHIKHDDPDFFEYSLEALRGAGFTVERVVSSVHGRDCFDPLLTEIQTAYEKRHLAAGRTIFYAEASVPLNFSATELMQ